MTHKVRYGTEYGYHYAACACKWRTANHLHRWRVEDDVVEHHRDVERLKIRLRGRPPTLTSERDWYQEMADDPKVEEKDRVVWQALADELSARLGDKKDNSDSPMFQMDS